MNKNVINHLPTRETESNLFIDTHTHLFSKEFNEDIDSVIERSIKAGVDKMYLPNINGETIDAMMQLTKKYPKNCFPMMGLHPCDVKANFKEELQLMEEWHSKYKFIAVGEIGLDLYWDKTFLEEQKQAFTMQVELAKKLNLPIVIHIRDAFDETFELMDKLNDASLTGIFHCFTGTIEQANRILDYGGFKLGVGGVVTFKNSGMDKVFNQIDLKHLVLETDSPYLTPTPHRGKRNESAYVKLIAEKLVDVCGVSLAEIASITTNNANEIFGKR